MAASILTKRTALIVFSALAGVLPGAWAQSTPLQAAAAAAAQGAYIPPVGSSHSAMPNVPAFPSGSISITPEGISKLKLTPGSAINLHVFEEVDLDGQYRLDDHGAIVVPLAGSVQVGSLTLHDAEKAIAEKLVTAGILKEAHVTVNIADYGTEYIVVSGEVVTPGRIPLLVATPLRQVIALAGGSTPMAGDEIDLDRGSKPGQASEVIHFKRNQIDNPGLDTMVNPGDSVLVKQAGIVYVLGAVVRPGGFVMQEDGSLDVMQAVSLAFGTAPEAALGRVRILRRNPDTSWDMIPIRLDRMQKGKVVPIELKPQDIVYVPPSLLKETGINAKAIAGGIGQAFVYRY